VSAHALVKERIDSEATKTLNEGIAKFYDESSGLWEDMWGQHMHHGYYEPGKRISNQQAQIDMIERTLDWAGVTSVKNTVDVGCGIGGSSRHIAAKYGSSGRGVTLSPVQAARANALTAEQGLAERVSFQVADALDMPFSDGEFDLAWSMESGEHMPDKERFVNELVRVTAPGGRVIIVTWCHRVLADGESALKPNEQALLDRICQAYYLPAWCSIADYERLFRAADMQDIKTDDWSEAVSPFWQAVIQSALSAKGVSGLLRAGWTTIKGALVMPLMARGLSTGLIKFNLITAVKPH
jgi:tocopherol O-methyltransferase